MNTLPEESKNWLGWRSEKHSHDEEMYYTVKNELDAPENYKNSANGKIAYSVKDGLELGSTIYGVGVLSNGLSKLPATVNALNLPNKVVSATAKVGDLAKAHPILTEKVVNSGTSMGFTYLANTLDGKDTSVSDLLWSGGTGFITGGKNFKTTLAVNTASGVAKAEFEGKDPIYAGGVALASTLAGGGTGLLVKKGSYRALVGDTARNKYYYDPKNRNEQFYNLGNEQYRYPERFGVLFDAYGSSKVGNMLDDNEKSIKKYIGVE